MSRLLLASALAVSLSTVAGVASADEPPAPGLATTQPDTWIPPTADSRFKHVALTLNPLGLFTNRVGVNVEYLPVRHHAFGINPFYQSLNAHAPDPKTTFTLFGGELGYRYYTGDDGADGLYFGPSFIAMRQSGTYSNGVSPSTTASSMVYGAAFDVGYQHVAKNGFTIGFGAGVMYLTAKDPSGGTSLAYYGSNNVSPRVLFTIGYSF